MRWVVLPLSLVIVVALGGARIVPWAAAATSTGDRAIFEPLTPARILDTRPSNPVGPGESRVLQVTGAGGVPADATAVVLNVTAVTPTAAGWLTVYPADATLPLASNVNFSAGQIVPNSVSVKLGSAGGDLGRIKIYNAAGQTHVIVDVGGYFRGHDHDDRYYAKVQTQARLAANSLTCPAGSFLNTVAADGTPTCGSTAQDPFSEYVGEVRFTISAEGCPTTNGVQHLKLVVAETIGTATAWNPVCTAPYFLSPEAANRWARAELVSPAGPEYFTLSRSGRGWNYPAPITMGMLDNRDALYDKLTVQAYVPTHVQVPVPTDWLVVRRDIKPPPTA